MVILALILAAAALGLATSTWLGQRQPGADQSSGSALPEDVVGLRREVAALQAENADALRHLSVVRYDAFGDVGGHRDDFFLALGQAEDFFQTGNQMHSLLFDNVCRTMEKEDETPVSSSFSIRDIPS